MKGSTRRIDFRTKERGDMNPSDYDGLTDQELDALMRKFKAEQRCSICGCSSQEVIAITEGPRNAPRARHEWNTPADLLQCIYCLRRIHFDIHQGGMVRGQCPLCSKQCATPSRECAICHSKLLSGKGSHSLGRTIIMEPTSTHRYLSSKTPYDHARRSLLAPYE